MILKSFISNSNYESNPKSIFLQNNRQFNSIRMGKNRNIRHSRVSSIFKI